VGDWLAVFVDRGGREEMKRKEAGVVVVNGNVQFL
jgi:hypothetical protein